MPPASRITDMHACPLHGGGPEISGSFDVITGYIPQGRVGDTLVCPPGVDVIVKGSSTVLVNNRQAARIGDPTAHGGKMAAGCPTVIIGDTGQGSTFSGASKDGTPFCEECEKARKKLEEQAVIMNTPPPPGSANALTKAGKEILADIKEKIDQILPPEKRQELEKVIKVIKPVAQALLDKGADEMTVADWAVKVRESIGVAYGVELNSYGDLAAAVYDRNKEKWGDALGPQVKWLMSEKGKTAREVIEAAASGNLKEKLGELKGDIVDQITEQVIDDPRARELIKGAVMGNFEEKAREVGGGIAKDVVGKMTGNEKIGELAEAAVLKKLPDKLGEMAGGAVDKFVGDIIAKAAPDAVEQTTKLFEPVTNYLKDQVTQKVIEKATEIVGGS